jgi:hypothetical protein
VWTICFLKVYGEWWSPFWDQSVRYLRSHVCRVESAECGRV